MSVRFLQWGRHTASAGLAAGLVAAAGVVALPPIAAAPAPALAAPAVQLSALVASLPLPAAAAPTPPVITPPSPGGSAGNAIINAYNAIEPWAQYGVELGAWAVGWLPWPISLAAPQMNIAYNGIEPVVQASVYSLAYLIDGQTSLIGPTLTNGVQTGFNNFVQGEIAWFASFFPPLPPINFPVAPGAAAPAPARSMTPPRVAAAVAVPVTGEPVGTAPAPVGTAPAPVAEQPVQPVASPVRRASRTPHTVAEPPPNVAPEPAAADAPEPAPLAVAPTVDLPAAAGPGGSDAESSPTRPARAARGHSPANDGASTGPRAASSTKAGRAGHS